MEECHRRDCRGQLAVVGTGPGAVDLITPRAERIIREAEVVIGYRTYLDLITDFFSPQQEVIYSKMMREIERCKQALNLAAEGKKVALVCGGDPGIYAMAGLVHELAGEMSDAPEVEIVPGIAALNSCAAILGAPLMHDFCAISLSDLLTPMALIEKRLEAAASADFVIVLYNPKSKKRAEHIAVARDIILKYRTVDTPVGIVTGATREHESVHLTTLAAMLETEINMQTAVIIGNSTTYAQGDRMITPRGYREKYRDQMSR